MSVAAQIGRQRYSQQTDVYVKLVRCGRSRSFKVIEIGTNRKPICDFLLVFHCNYVPIFYRF